MDESRKTEKIALFVDLENFIGFSHDLRLPFELEPIIKKLTEDVGKVLFRRSFGDLTEALNGVYRRESIRHVRQMLQRNLVQHEDIPYDRGYKNSSDIRLVVEALNIAFSHPDVTAFAVVSGDRDYIPLFNKLRELDKTVIGVSGNQATVTDRFREACDSVFYTNDLYKTQTGSLTDVSTEVEIADVSALREEYLDLLIRAAASLDEQGKRTVGGNLKPQMSRMQSDFDPTRAGFDSFKDFVAFAAEKGIVEMRSQGGDFIITPPNQASADTQIVSESATENLTEIYRRFMETKLKQPLPTRETRRKIYEVASELLNDLDDDYAVSLSDLSNDVTDKLLETNYPVTQKTIYKLLYTLHRANCFIVEDSPDSYDPRIISVRPTVKDWDEELIFNAISLMRREMHSIRFVPQDLSLLFYENTDDAGLIEDKLRRLLIGY